MRVLQPAMWGLLTLMACTQTGPKGDTGPAGPQGPAGPPGATGAAGAAGAPGAAGAAGAPGLAGAQGPKGDKGDTGATGATGMRGADGAPGLPGTTGQDVLQALSTAQLALAGNATTCSLVPGLSLSLNVPADASVYVNTNGGLQCTGTGSAYSVADIVLFIDGNSSLGRRVVAANTAALAQIVSSWSFGRAYDLPAGVHTIEVGACGIGDANASTANIASGSAPQLQAVLTAMILKK